jgi:DNA repair protein RecO (recombination protein O)
MAIVTTKAIVIHAIKYGDTSLIVRCFTLKEGLKSYLIRGVLTAKKGKVKIAYFQPLTQLSIEARHTKRDTLNSIKEVHIVNPYTQIYANVYKQTIVLFLSEVLASTIQEEEENMPLYEYLETALNWLDAHVEVSNFHLLFLLNLTRFLGFYPDTRHTNYPQFNLLEGCFTSSNSEKESIKNNELTQFKKLLGINFDSIHKVSFNKTERQQVLQIIMRYFELQLEGFKYPKSLRVLETVFN